MTSNEIRQKIGMKPSDDPRADQLVNSNNITQPIEGDYYEYGESYPEEETPYSEEEYPEDSGNRLTMNTKISDLT